MFYVISQYWLWELLALALGAVVGWLTFTGEPGGWLRGWFKWALVAFAIGLPTGRTPAGPTGIRAILPTRVTGLGAARHGTIQP